MRWRGILAGFPIRFEGWERSSPGMTAGFDPSVEPMTLCELQEALGGVNPSTLSSRLKMLEEEGLVHRAQVSTIPPHVEYSLTPMGHELRGVIREITNSQRLLIDCHR